MHWASQTLIGWLRVNWDTLTAKSIPMYFISPYVTESPVSEFEQTRVSIGLICYFMFKPWWIDNIRSTCWSVPNRFLECTYPLNFPFNLKLNICICIYNLKNKSYKQGFYFHLNTVVMHQNVLSNSNYVHCFSCS